MSEFGLTEFDLNQDAVDWARGHVERVRDKWRAWEHRARDEGDRDRMMRARRIANVLQMELIGGEGCSITAFDVRGPKIRAALLPAKCHPGCCDDDCPPCAHLAPASTEET